MKTLAGLGWYLITIMLGRKLAQLTSDPYIVGVVIGAMAVLVKVKLLDDWIDGERRQ